MSRISPPVGKSGAGIMRTRSSIGTSGSRISACNTKGGGGFVGWPQDIGPSGVQVPVGPWQAIGGSSGAWQQQQHKDPRPPSSGNASDEMRSP